jgi:hypothetical protein
MTSSDRALRELVSAHHAAVVGDWLELVYSGYPQETARFLRTTKDPFGNPVGTALREELGTVLDGTVGAIDDESLRTSLDRIIRIRAVQDFAPSAAIGFLLDLKPILRRLVDESGGAGRDELDLVDRWVDRVVVMAFDVYTSCREQVFEIRVRSIRDLSLKQIERLNEWRIRRDGRAPAADAETSPHEGRSKEWAP